MLDEAENKQADVDAAYRNQGKNAVKREADQKISTSKYYKNNTKNDTGRQK